MRLTFKHFSHEAPRVQAPKDAGVVFSNHVYPLRFTLNFKPWLFLCVVGFTGTFCGNFFYKKFLLRPNPPNPKRDPSETPPERHPHAPDDYSGFGGKKFSLNRGINIKSNYGFINGIGINNYYRNNNKKNKNFNFKLFENEDISNINEEEEISNDYYEEYEDEETHGDEEEDGQGYNENHYEKDEGRFEEDMISNEEVQQLRTSRKLKIPYIMDYPTDKVDSEPDMTKEDVAKSILYELGFFNELDCSVGNNLLYQELKNKKNRDNNKDIYYGYNNNKEEDKEYKDNKDRETQENNRGEYIKFIEDTTSTHNLYGKEDGGNIGDIENKEKEEEEEFLEFDILGEDENIDDIEDELLEMLGGSQEYEDRDNEEENEYEDNENKNRNNNNKDNRDNKENNEKELVLRKEKVLRFSSDGNVMGLGGRLGDGDEEDEEVISKDYLVRTSAVDKLAPKLEEGDTPSILEEQESPVIGKQRVRWFPNYVSKSLRKLHDYLKLSDIILDVRDGRIPFIPPNDYLFNLFESEFPTKPRITVFTHSDVLPKIAMAEWMNYYRKINKSVTKEYNQNINNTQQRRVENKTMFVDARNGLKEIIYLKKHIYKMCRKIRMRSLEKGMKPRAIRAIVIGMPNVGKSSLINRILGRKVAKAYDIPGTTRDINIYNEEKGNKDKQITMIDTPGFVCPIQDNHRLINDYNSIFCNRIIGSNRRRHEIGYGYDRDKRMLIYSGLNIIGEAAYEVDEVALVILEEIIKMLMQNPRYVDYVKIKQKYPLLASLINRYTPIKIKKIKENTNNNNKDNKEKEENNKNKEEKDKNEQKNKEEIKKENNKNKEEIRYEYENNIKYNPEDLEQEVSMKMDRIATWLFGGNLDSCCSRFLTDFRKGRLGQIMLQSPPVLFNFYLNYLDGNRKYKMEKARKKSKNIDRVVEYNRGIYEGW